MQELFDYLDTGDINNEQLYIFFAKLSKNAIIKAQLAKPAHQEKHLRYQVHKLLPAEQQVKYKEFLLPSAKKAEVAEPQRVLDENEQSRDISPKKTDTSISDNEIRRLTNEANILANRLGDFAEDDNDGRAQVMAQIAEIESQIKNAREGAKPAKEFKEEFDFEKTKLEIEKMNDAEKRDYKSLLARRKNRAKTSLEQKPDDKKAPQWQAIFDKCEELQLMVG